MSRTRRTKASEPAPGPWTDGDGAVYAPHPTDPDEHIVVCDYVSPADVAFIVSAHTEMPALRADLERTREELDAEKDAHSSLRAGLASLLSDMQLSDPDPAPYGFEATTIDRVRSMLESDSGPSAGA